MKKWVWLLLCFVTFGALAVYWVERSKDAESKRISESSLREAREARSSTAPTDAGLGNRQPPAPRAGGDSAGSPSAGYRPSNPGPGSATGGTTQTYEPPPPPPPTDFDAVAPPPSPIYPDSGVADSELYPNPGYVPPELTDPDTGDVRPFEMEPPIDPLEGVDPQYLPTEPLEGEAIPPEEFE